MPVLVLMSGQAIYGAGAIAVAGIVSLSSKTPRRVASCRSRCTRNGTTFGLMGIHETTLSEPSSYGHSNTPLIPMWVIVPTSRYHIRKTSRRQSMSVMVAPIGFFVPHHRRPKIVFSVGNALLGYRT